MRPTRVVRSGGDAVRLALAFALAWATSWYAHQTTLPRFEINAFRLINDLPGAFGPPLIGAMQLGALAAVPVFAIIALLARRRPLARVVVLAGASSWLVAKLLQNLVDQESPNVVLARVTLHGAVRPGLAFPATHVAVAAGLATVASPYLTRPNRRLAWVAVAVIAVARVYVGVHFPVDVLGGAAVGWGMGSLVHLLLGAPRGTPSPALVEHVVGEMGFAVRHVTELVAAETGSAMFRIDLGDGTSQAAKVVSRDQPEADWLYRAWRLIAFREAEDNAVIVDPGHRVEHEAYMLLNCSRAGVRVPALTATRTLGDGESLVLRSWINGKTLASVDPSEVPDTVLGDLWDQVDALHDMGAAHRALRADHAVVDRAGRVWLVEVATVRLDATTEDRDRDVAELCASLAQHVPPASVAASVSARLSPARLASVVPLLQPLALTPATRRQVARQPERLDAMRAAMADAAGIPVPATEAPVRVAARNLLPLIGALIAVNVLFAEVGHARPTVSAVGHANVGWLFVVLGAAVMSYVMASVTLLGAAGRRLAFGRTFSVQIAGAFTNRLTPANLGGLATNVRYLEASGSPRPAALGAVTLGWLAALVAHIAGAIAVAPLLGTSHTHLHLSGPELPDRWPILVTVFGSLVVLGLARWGSRLRRHVTPRLRIAGQAIRDAMHRPLAVLALLGGACGVTAAYALGLAASAQAFDLRLPVAAVIAVYLGGSFIAAIAPTPGGLGAIEATLVAGLTAAGAAAAPAVAAVLAFRLITYWLPAVPGAVAFRMLRKAGSL
jgi:glycosyltransferase 2 family protein